MTTSHHEYDYDFVPPAEAPVFSPKPEEFKDALAYFEKIRKIAEHYGICKIVPPEDWKPQFSVDIDKLKFTPRIQRLNELEAHTRIKLNYLDQVAKFWELQGSSLKIPIVEKRALDLFTLKKYVNKSGGMAKVSAEKRWNMVAGEMGYNPTNCVKIGALLKSHYERILYPLDVFEKEEAAKAKEEQEQRKVMLEKQFKEEKKARQNNVKLSKAEKAEEDSKAFSKELQRLQFYGAGPKLSGVPTQNKMEKTRGVKLNFEYDPLAKYMCQNCGKGDAEEQMLLCDGCDDSYHTFCLMPPLSEIPQGDWRCPKCVLAEVSKPMEAFGFEQAQKEYTLQSFGEMADQFKSDYFNMPLHLIPMSLVEREYWRILDNIDEDVMVEYGADLHTMDHGSGFPTTASKHLKDEDSDYANAEWNLNNMPVMANSILKQIDIDISGMKVPWLYVGMCFSTFCWHVEDHWTPSINYLHWGEPKTWYGIPAKYAEKAEEVMRSSAKELFDSQPDLLHHIVTTMNPNVLAAHGIPVYRMDQYAGEFIITFPRAYHAGFNHGYNMAEAVNFAPPDWLEIGRKCVEHYSLMRRFCVFCHDELICKMATRPEQLTLQVAAVCYKDMLRMVESEKHWRAELMEGGVRAAEREAFELLPEDERQCALCKTTCFNSALTVINGRDDQEIVCLRHFKSMDVNPSQLILRYRYTMDELAILLRGLKVHAESYDNWTSQVRAALDARGEQRMEFSVLKEFFNQALEKKYPESELMLALQTVVEEADKCQMVAHQLCSTQGKVRTRLGADAKYRLTVEELELFVNQLETLPAKVSGQEGVCELLRNVAKFKETASRLLEKEKSSLEEVQKCLEKGEMLDIYLPEVERLRARLDQLDWLKEVKEVLEDPSEISTDLLTGLENRGCNLKPRPEVEAGLSRLRGLRVTMDQWESRAGTCLQAANKSNLEEVERLVREGENISSGLPSLERLREACRKAKEWWSRAENLQKPENYPYLDTLEALVAKGRPLPIRLDPLAQLETQVAAARAWRERTARVFLKKNSACNLLEVLSPRHDIGSEKKRRKRTEEGNYRHPIFLGLSAIQLSDPQEIVNAFKQAEQTELVTMKELRLKNEALDQKDGLMLECELCMDRFPPGSTPLPRLPSGAQKPTSLREVKFLCQNCLRSRRPRLETILSLLVSLQKLTVRLPEGEALQCLTERAMAWQDRARTILATPDISAALKKLSIQSKEEEERLTGDDNSADGTTDSESDTPAPPKKRSAVSQEVITLPKKTHIMLEDLLVEGDLLEVSLDEVSHIWRLLQATPERRSRTYPEIDCLEAELIAAREEKKKEKQKKRDKQDSEEERERRKIKKKKKDEKRKKEEQKKEETEDDCSAKSCKRPTGKQVHWVQCDKCTLWFHLFCIGLKPQQIKEDEEFYCGDCGKPGGKRKKKQMHSDMDTD